MTVRIALALVAALLLCPIAARADVVGIGDITPSQTDPFDPAQQIPDLPQFGGTVGGTITVGGTGSTVGGTSAGQMTIDIPSDTDPLVSTRGVIGGNGTGFGLVRVLSLNSQWTVDQDLIVGNEGQGMLELVGGSRVFSGNGGVNTVTPYDLQVGAVQGSQGFVTIDGFASLLLHRDLGLGVGGFGSIEVLNFGRLESANSALLGGFDTANLTSGEGYVLVEGRGSRWNIGTAGSGLPGNLTLGGAGRGTVDVFDEGFVFAQGVTILGELPDSFGEIVVAGRNSQFRTGGVMQIGLLGNGTVEIGDRGLVRVDGITSVGGGGLVEFAGGTLQTPAVVNAGVMRGDGRIQAPLVTNDGDIRTAAGIANLRERLWITGDLDNNNYIDSIGGEMEVEGLVTNNANIYGDNAVFRFRGGLVDAGGPTSLVRLNNTIIESPNVQLANLEIAPQGNSTIVGDLTLGGGTLEMTIGDDFNRFIVAGFADLSGDLRINFDDGYIPEGGDSFELIKSDSILGVGFNEPIDIPVTPGVAWDVDYSTPGSVFLNFYAGVAPDLGVGADFDNSNLVDGLDLAIWETNYGMNPATQPDGDANYDGFVDGHDFLKWQRQVGTNPVSIAPVPEPSTVVLALFGLTISLTTTARRTRR